MNFIGDVKLEKDVKEHIEVKKGGLWSENGMD